MRNTDLLISVRLVQGADAPALCGPILRSVPEWFGIEEYTRSYIDATAVLPTWVAFAGGAPAGFVSLKHHQPKASDVYCMAVKREFHGRGIGAALLRQVEEELRRAGFEYLQVKTQGPSRPSAEYAGTLRFYEKVGFTRLEEFSGIWPGIPCLLLVKKL
jgi:ribosomal protein S18 acetylase RimI-like enzyme